MRMNDLVEQSNKVLLYNKLSLHCHQNKETIWPTWKMNKPVISPYIRRNYFPNRQIDYEGSLGSDGYSLLHSGSEVVEVVLGKERYLQFTFKSVEECRNRVYLLALGSYRIYGSKKFMPLSK